MSLQEQGNPILSLQQYIGDLWRLIQIQRMRIESLERQAASRNYTPAKPAGQGGMSTLTDSALLTC